MNLSILCVQECDAFAECVAELTVRTTDIHTAFLRKNASLSYDFCEAAFQRAVTTASSRVTSALASSPAVSAGAIVSASKVGLDVLLEGYMSEARGPQRLDVLVERLPAAAVGMLSPHAAAVDEKLSALQGEVEIARKAASEASQKRDAHAAEVRWNPLHRRMFCLGRFMCVCVCV
ncbi:MAG: hypothetical protein P4L40_05350 [Terracidiphilus sp.]|nr:hypothetical protein [Terracidiphilus sp.]